MSHRSSEAKVAEMAVVSSQNQQTKADGYGGPFTQAMLTQGSSTLSLQLLWMTWHVIQQELA